MHESLRLIVKVIHPGPVAEQRLAELQGMLGDGWSHVPIATTVHVYIKQWDAAEANPHDEIDRLVERIDPGELDIRVLP
jgi:hypothetical protein